MECTVNGHFGQFLYGYLGRYDTSIHSPAPVPIYNTAWTHVLAIINIGSGHSHGEKARRFTISAFNKYGRPHENVDCVPTVCKIEVINLLDDSIIRIRAWIESYLGINGFLQPIFTKWFMGCARIFLGCTSNSKPRSPCTYIASSIPGRRCGARSLFPVLAKSKFAGKHSICRTVRDGLRLCRHWRKTNWCWKNFTHWHWIFYKNRDTGKWLLAADLLTRQLIIHSSTQEEQWERIRFFLLKQSLDHLVGLDHGTNLGSWEISQCPCRRKYNVYSSWEKTSLAGSRWR